MASAALSQQRGIRISAAVRAAAGAAAAATAAAAAACSCCRGRSKCSQVSAQVRPVVVLLLCISLVCLRKYFV